MGNKRKGLRARLELGAVCTAYGVPQTTAHVCDISKSGLQLRIGVPLSIGAYVDITFDPGVSIDPLTRSRTQLAVRGRVVRLVSAEPSHTYGVELHLDDATANTLQWAATLKHTARTDE